MEPSAGNTQLLVMYNEISQQLGFGEVKAVNPRKAGAADISFTATYVDMAMDGIGLMGTGAHTDNEIADMTSFNSNTQKAALLLHRLAKMYANKK